MHINRGKIVYATLAIFATTLWGSAFAGAKIGFEYMPPIMLSGIRFMLAGILLIPMLFIFKISLRTQLKHWRFMLIFGLVQTFLQYGLFYWGLDLVPAAIAAIVIGAGPLFIAIMAHFTLANDKLNIRKIVAIALGIAGVVSISFGDALHGLNTPTFYKGIALLLISNIVGSYTNIMVVKKSAAISPIMLTLFANFTGGVLLFITSLFIEDATVLTTHFPTEFYLAILWLAFIPAGAFSAWYYLLSLPNVKVSELNIWKFIIPIVGVVLSWWLIPNEHPTANSILGITIISLSLLVLQLPVIIGRFKRAK